MGKFLITKRINGEYQFNLIADNGQIILTSEGYYSKAACANGIESVRKNSKEESCYDKRTSSNRKYYFNLKAANAQIIGTSEMYESEISRNHGITSVRAIAPGAVVHDQS